MDPGHIVDDNFIAILLDTENSIYFKDTFMYHVDLLGHKYIQREREREREGVNKR